MENLLVCDDGEPEKAVPVCLRFGCGIEVQAFYNPLLVEEDPASIERHRALMDGIEPRSVHGCFGDLCPGSFDPMVRAVARNRFDLSYRVASRLGAAHLVLHHGYVPHTSPPDRWLTRCIAFWNDFLADKDGSVRIHIENILEWDAGLIADLVDGIGREDVDANLDLGHVSCNARAGLMDWIQRLGGRIGYVHIHDNHGQDDEHLALGRGTIPLQEALLAIRAVSPRAVWAVETEVDGLAASVEWLVGRGLLPGEANPA
jgi:sugar phosphate isomerase/epimerase